MLTGRTPREQEDRDQGRTSTGQGALPSASKPPEAPGESEGTSSAQASSPQSKVFLLSAPSPWYFITATPRKLLQVVILILPNFRQFEEDY